MSVSSDNSPSPNPRLDSFMESFGDIIRETRQHATVILGLAGLLQREVVGALNDDQKELMNALTERTAMLTHYLNQAIYLSEIDLPQRQIEVRLCNVRDLIQQAISRAWNKTKNRDACPAINTTQVSEELYVLVNELDIERALFQVIDNAIRYNIQNNSITIQTIDTEVDVQITISDKGIGITQEDQRNIFTRHVRIWREDHPQFSGAGLGLYITQQFIIRNKGTISLQSDKDIGCTIFISLPKENGAQ